MNDPEQEIDKKSELVGVDRYAKHRGVSRKAVQRAIESGRITAIIDSKTGRKQIDPAEADRMWQRNTDPSKIPHAALVTRAPMMSTQSNSVSEATIDLFGQKAKHEEYKAELARLKLQRELGRLVPIEEIQKSVENEYSFVRTRLLSIPSKLALELSKISDPGEIKSRIEAAITEALAELTSDQKYASPTN